MKIGYFADGPWSHRALERIKGDARFEVTFIVARFPHPDEALRAKAAEMSVPFYVPENVNAPEFLDLIRGASELNVSLSYSQILGRPIIDLAAHGFINCHAGGLPFYRGRNILNWALINGEEQFGVTVHEVDEGIDTGDILVQEWVAIEDDDDYGSVLEKAYEQCGESLHEALILIAEDRVQRISQESIHHVGMYCGMRTIGDEWINWEWPSERIHNFIRALNLPGPAARTIWQENELAILASQLVPGALEYIGTPGQIVGRSAEGVLVKTGDSILQVRSVADVTEKGLATARCPKFRMGSRFQARSEAELARLRARVEELENRLQRFEESSSS